MASELKPAIEALKTFSTQLRSTISNANFNNHVMGWNSSPLSVADLAERVSALSDRLEGLSDDLVSDSLKRKAQNLPSQIAYFQSQSLPQLLSGNIATTLSLFDSLMANVESAVPSMIPSRDWVELDKAGALPLSLAKRLRSVDAQLGRFEPKMQTLARVIGEIESAHTAAMELPTDLESLREARDGIQQAAASIESVLKESQDTYSAIRGTGHFIEEKKNEAASLIKNIEGAYSAATTAGLAASFSERAAALRTSTWVWVALLLGSLVSGGILGAHRLDAFQTMMNRSAVDAHWMWLSAGMSILSIAAPLWFAWLSTRQISQRFRLSEDYAFKAAVARAYEGYRREAARLDKELERRLFAAALDRLEEPPLRFVSVEEHSSPYEALLASAGFQKILDKLPGPDRADLLKHLKPKAPRKKRVSQPIAPNEPELAETEA